MLSPLNFFRHKIVFHICLPNTLSSPNFQKMYSGADKSLARPASRCILFNGYNISFESSLFIYINSTNISPIMIISRIYENQNLVSL
jgi:hypothetical protein